MAQRGRGVTRRVISTLKKVSRGGLCVRTRGGRPDEGANCMLIAHRPTEAALQHLSSPGIQRFLRGGRERKGMIEHYPH